jgi:hypothetical protein
VLRDGPKACGYGVSIWIVAGPSFRRCGRCWALVCGAGVGA